MNAIDVANASGFPLQIGVQREVEKTHESHEWRVLAGEFHWAQPDLACDGFADLLLQRQNDRIVIECKRFKSSSSFVFLVPTDLRTTNAETTQRLFWIHRSDQGQTYEGWGNGMVLPHCSSSSFCVISRSNGSGQSLEALCKDLLLSCEAIGRQELMTMNARSQTLTAIYLPVVVTTAKLSVCEFSSDSVDLASGLLPHELSRDGVKEVKYVRFTKSLWTGHRPEHNWSNLEEADRGSARTVFVVTACALTEFLTHLRIKGSFPAEPWSHVRH